MKRVIYINCWVTPWVEVAKQLKEKYGLEPIWWIGYSKQDNSHILVPESFPSIIFQDDADAWKGRFPKNIEERAANCFLDVDFLKRHAHHELQAIKMMDRMDQDLRSFNFMERQRHFRNMLKQWIAAIEIVKPDLVVSTAIPHRLYDYVLYWLCEERRIPFLTIQHTQFPGRFYISKNDFYTIGNRFIDDWHKYEKLDDIKIKLTDDIRNRYEKVKLDYEKGAPVFMEALSKREKKMQHPLYIIKRWTKRFATSYRPYIWGKPADKTIIGICAYDKRANKKYEESEGNVYLNEKIYLKANKYKKQLKRKYESLCTPPDYSEKYIAFFLHYQPEATSCPGGDIFVDQRLCIELLLKNLPSIYKIYVKEHPHQFSRTKNGHSGRMQDLYDDLVKNDRVRLISTNIASFDLINNAKAVSTITGTAGWEAMVRFKPVIAFGLCWYENYSKGVLRITDEKSAKNILSFIENYQFDEHSLLAYLTSVGKNTYISDYFKKNRKNLIDISDKESADNIIKAIIETL